MTMTPDKPSTCAYLDRRDYPRRIESREWTQRDMRTWRVALAVGLTVGFAAGVFVDSGLDVIWRLTGTLT